ncbi:MAG: serine hydrolase domain-containing protein [Pseudomonadota bacterium]
MTAALFQYIRPSQYIRSSAASFIALLLIASVGTDASRAANVAEDGDFQAATRLFSAWIEDQIAYRGIPGIVVGVVSDDDLVWTQTYGHADLEASRPMTVDTRFRMASHSKLFTATAIMQLREQGKLRLDDPVQDYLSWFSVIPSNESDPPITIEHLLTHSSGLPREAGPHWSDRNFPSAEEFRTLTPDRQAAYPPEARWKYSNYAYTLAGMVVEAVSGMNWSAYLQANIFAPLGMSASSVDVEDPLLATGYGRRMPDGGREVMPFVDARSMAAATGLSSTVGDMAKFVSAQFREGARGGDRLLSTASLREMHRVRMMENNWKRGQGLGFSVMRVGEDLHIGHGGGYPGYTTHTRIHMDGGVGVIVLTNTNDSYPSRISEQLMKTVGRAAIKAKEEDPDLAWDPAWARFAGLYRSPWSDTRVVLMNEQLVLLRGGSLEIDTDVSLRPIGGDRFVMEAPLGGSTVGEIVRFIEVDGEVTRMITGDSFATRVSR